VSGLHLPAYAAAASGAFADHGIEIEFVDCVSTPGGGLTAWSAMIAAVADGDADLALTSVAYLLAGQTAARGLPSARFAAVFHQENPLAALVRHDSPLRLPADLAGAKVAASGSWYLRELESGLEHLGLPPLTRVEVDGDPRAALRAGELDLIPGWADMLPSYSGEGLRLRTIPLEVEAYTTGLVAADRLELDVIVRARDALVAGYHLQREQPRLGIESIRRAVPKLSENHLSIGWSAFEPYAFARAEPLAMSEERWRRTIDYTAATHGLPTPSPERVYRPELVASALARV
jgi:ABC-type nitrate/sulfonate/bicarbonate transport system substrate-binding protein